MPPGSPALSGLCSNAITSCGPGPWKGIEAGVLRDDVKERRGVLRGEGADVIGNVKVERIGARRRDHDILGVCPECLNRCGKSYGDFRLIRTQKDFGLEWSIAKQRKIGGLDILLVN
jgi:hypothetical protein